MSATRRVPNDGTAEEQERAPDEGEVRLELLRSRLLGPDELDRLPPPVPLIDGYLTRGSLAAIYGRPGTGKSFIAMSMAFAVVTGTPWFGHAVEQGRVLYVAAEGTAGLAQRQRAWREMCGSPRLEGMHWLPMAVNLFDAGWSSGLAKLAAELRPLLVIVDTLARSMPGGDENASSDMGRAVDAADRVRVESGATVELVHHTPKDGSTLRGHSALEGAVDTALLCEANGRTVTVTVSKQKDQATTDPLVLELVPVGSSCVPAVSRGRETRYELVESESRVRQAIWDHCETDGLPGSTLLELAGVPKPSFYRALKSLREKGIVRNVGTDKRPRYAAAEDLEGLAVSRSLTKSHEPVSSLVSPAPFRAVRHETGEPETGLW